MRRFIAGSLVPTIIRAGGRRLESNRCEKAAGRRLRILAHKRAMARKVRVPTHQSRSDKRRLRVAIELVGGG